MNETNQTNKGQAMNEYTGSYKGNPGAEGIAAAREEARERAAAEKYERELKSDEPEHFVLLVREYALEYGYDSIALHYSHDEIMDRFVSLADARLHIREWMRYL